MRNLEPFDWRKLTNAGTVEYCFDGNRILVRNEDGDEPFSLDKEKAVPCHWEQQDDVESFVLRTNGSPSTVRKLWAHFGPLIREISDATGVDERILLVQSACEAYPSSRHPSGKSLESPRTEKGYPNRTSEMDFGDSERDAQDWRRSKGAHSSHGLTQLLIYTAALVRPDLFVGLRPEDYRTVLHEPRNAYACLASLVLRLKGSVRSDPLATRVAFGAGAVREAKNRWGVVYYSEGVLLHWIAFWNDFASIT